MQTAFIEFISPSDWYPGKDEEIEVESNEKKWKESWLIELAWSTVSHSVDSMIVFSFEIFERRNIRWRKWAVEKRLNMQMWTR